MKALLISLLVYVLFQPLWLAAEITAPKTVPAGGVLEITWSGEIPKGGRFQVVTSKGESLKGGAYGYMHKVGKPISIAAPLKPGTYGVALAQGGEFKGLKTYEVTPVTATLEVPKTVEINSQFKVTWTGPAYSSDIVAITDVGGNRRSSSYTYPKISKDGTVTLTAPLKPGAYEVIYQMKDEILAREAFTVGGTEASLQVPKTVQAGGDLEIHWQGPNNQGDIISVVSPGATKRGTIYTYSGISTGNRVMLTVGETLGDYEVIYLTGSEMLARAPFKVIEVSATLEAPAEVVATLAFEIAWSGPANRKDSIVMMPKGMEPKRPYASLSYVVKDEPVATMIAPKDPGDYTLHYVTREGKVLATRPIKVAPAPSDPGFLKVVSNSSKGFGDNTAVELILDASGSMLKRQGKKRRIEIAKETILGLLSDVIPSGTGFAMRVFGHKEADSCRTDLEIPLGPLDTAAAKLKVAGINAMNLAKTPIAASLAKVGSDLNGVTGERIVILVTDGEETCDGEPALAIRELRSQGSDVRVNIVGYSIDDAALQETFQSWAAVGGGQYLNAPDESQLAKALRSALEIPFEVFASDKLTASGVSGGIRLELPAGEYQIRYRWDGQELTKAVTVGSNAEANIVLP